MRFIIILIFTIYSSFLFSYNIRAFWATSWDINSKENIDQMVENTVNNNFNTIIAEIRYRGDALYTPNKLSNSFTNTEKKSYMLKENFDALQYLIDKTQNTDIKVYAWITTFVATPNNTKSLDPSHVFFTHPEWITTKKNNYRMDPTSLEGAYLDPGIPEVQNYLINIICDIVTNYDIDGIQFDYIRYPSKEYGYNKRALKIFEEENKNNFINWEQWKENQITGFMKRAYAEIKSINPQIQISSAVIADFEKAKNKYSQNWIKWINEGYLDIAYTMSYSKYDSFFKYQIQNLVFKNIENKVVVGIRAWSDDFYSSKNIISKIKTTLNYDFKGISCFHYGGMIKNNYFSPIKKELFPTFKTNEKDFYMNNFLYGYLFDEDNNCIKNAEITILPEKKTTFTDNNGFFMFSNLLNDYYELQIKDKNEILHSQKIDITKSNKFTYHKKNNPVNNLKETSIYCIATKSLSGININWSTKESEPVSIYRKTTSYINNRPVYKQELVHIETDSVQFWVDKNYPLNADFQYQIISKSGKESNLTYPIKSPENLPMEVNVRCEKDKNVKFLFHLQKSSKLNWKLLDKKGNNIIRKNSWYNKGETIEVWNGITEMGANIQSGFYTLLCFSETWTKYYKKTIYINREG